MLLRFRHAVASAALGLLVVPAVVRAETKTEAPMAVALEYDVPAVCPSVEAFRQRIEARGSEHATFLESSEKAELRVRVRVTTEAERQARAELTIVDGRGDTSERSLDAATCEELVEASALLVAIALEAEPRTTAPKPAVVTERAVLRGPSPLSLVAYGGAGVGAGVGLGLGPSLEAGVGIRSDRGWAPEARLEGRQLWLGTAETEGGAARFDLVAGAAEGCPVAYRGYGLRIAPCVALAVGRLAAKASGYAAARERAILYVGAEVGARLTIDVGSVFVGVEGWGIVPLTRETFIFGTAGTAHRLASLGVSSSATIGMYFR